MNLEKVNKLDFVNLDGMDFQLSPIELDDDYKKKWNIRIQGMNGGFLVITKNGKPIRNTLYRIGGVGGQVKDGYITLIKYKEDHYDGDWAKGKTKAQKRHLSSSFVIIDRFGIEKVECGHFERFYHVGGLIYINRGQVLNLETGNSYCEKGDTVESDEFLFVSNPYRKDKSLRGVYKIHKYTGECEVFPIKS